MLCKSSSLWNHTSINTLTCTVPTERGRAAECVGKLVSGGAHAHLSYLLLMVTEFGPQVESETYETCLDVKPALNRGKKLLLIR